MAKKPAAAVADTTVAATITEVTTTTAATPKADRKRFSFGPVWNAAIIAGKIKDHEKLIAHAVHLKVAAKSDAVAHTFEDLLAKVKTALETAPAEATTTATTGDDTDLSTTAA